MTLFKTALFTATIFLTACNATTNRSAFATYTVTNNGGVAIAQRVSEPEIDFSRTTADSNPRAARALTGHYTPHVTARGIEAVNDAVNGNRYVAEKVDTWNPNDLWSNGGDCEDFATAKLLELKAQGMTAPMFITIVRDRVQNQHHAVLAIKEGARMTILDNQAPHIWHNYSSFKARYEPIYAMDEKGHHMGRFVPNYAAYATAQGDTDGAGS